MKTRGKSCKVARGSVYIDVTEANIKRLKKGFSVTKGMGNFRIILKTYKGSTATSIKIAKLRARIRKLQAKK